MIWSESGDEFKMNDMRKMNKDIQLNDINVIVSGSLRTNTPLSYLNITELRKKFATVKYE